MPTRILFITGTDTGVGKTLLTGLLTAHLLDEGRRVVALKPFCSGGTEDVEFLSAMQAGAVPREVINPYYFPEPVAPLVSARRHRRRVRLGEVVARIRRTGAPYEYILIEGSGGLLVPLGAGFDVRDLIAALDCEVILVSRNRLGTINHTLLTAEALRKRGCKLNRVVLMEPPELDFSARTNLGLMRELVVPTHVFSISYIGIKALVPAACRKQAKKLKKTLACILG